MTVYMLYIYLEYAGAHSRAASEVCGLWVNCNVSKKIE